MKTDLNIVAVCGLNVQANLSEQIPEAINSDEHRQVHILYKFTLYVGGDGRA